MLFELQTAISGLELGLVEGLRLIEVVTVRSPVLVSVQVLLCLPGGAVPELAVALVATGKRLGALVHLELGRVLKQGALLTCAPVGLVVDGGAQVARPCRRREVVLWLRVGGRVGHGTRSVTTAAHFQRGIVLRDQRRVEPNQGMKSETVKLITTRKERGLHSDGIILS